jgi:hypothetical protein
MGCTDRINGTNYLYQTGDKRDKAEQAKLPEQTIHAIGSKSNQAAQAKRLDLQKAVRATGSKSHDLPTHATAPRTRNEIANGTAGGEEGNLALELRADEEDEVQAAAAAG